MEAVVLWEGDEATDSHNGFILLLGSIGISKICMIFGRFRDSDDLINFKVTIVFSFRAY